jgi:uncharacterized protein YbjT (DUF2867 family)
VSFYDAAVETPNSEGLVMYYRAKWVLCSAVIAVWGVGVGPTVAQTSGINVDWGIARDQAATVGSMADVATHSEMQGYEIAAARRQTQALQAEQLLKRQVGALFAQGRCQEALSASITGGDLELARLVDAACKEKVRQ